MKAALKSAIDRWENETDRLILTQTVHPVPPEESACSHETEEEAKMCRCLHALKAPDPHGMSLRAWRV